MTFAFAANSQVYHGLLHDFADGNNHAWQRGEVVENKLHITADGSGNQGKLVTFSQDEFAGNYLEAGVHTISAKISNASDQALHMRVALGTGSNPKQGDWFASKDAIIVDAGEMDKEVAFGETISINESKNLLEISSIYPNPVTDYAHISIKTESAFSAQLSILNLLGHLFIRKKLGCRSAPIR